MAPYEMNPRKLCEPICPNPVGEVTAQLANLCEGFDNLEKCVSALSDRLTSVLRVPDAEPEEVPPHAAFCPLAGQLNALVGRVVVLCTRLRKLEQNCQL